MADKQSEPLLGPTLIALGLLLLAYGVTVRFTSIVFGAPGPLRFAGVDSLLYAAIFIVAGAILWRWNRKQEPNPSAISGVDDNA